MNQSINQSIKNDNPKEKRGSTETKAYMCFWFDFLLSSRRPKQCLISCSYIKPFFLLEKSLPIIATFFVACVYIVVFIVCLAHQLLASIQQRQLIISNK